MTHGSLFSGIGGFDLAAQWMGWENVFHCEWNPICQRVLKYHFPKSISYEDITKTDFTVHRGRIDLITGGFPCQPYSMAGKRLGKDDERHLFPEMLRAIREIQPRWVVGENVFGLVNWNGGLVFEEVQADLEAEGYEVQPFILPACGVQNAPHRRDRVWFIAYRSSGIEGKEVSARDGEKALNGVAGHGAQVIAPDTERVGCSQSSHGEIKTEFFSKPERKGINGSSVCVESVKTNGLRGDVADTDCIRLQQCENTGEVGRGQAEMGGQGSESTNAIETNGEIKNAPDTDDKRLEREATNGNMERQQRPLQRSIEGSGQWDNFPTQSPVCSRDDGFSDRLDGITFSKWRNESIKGYGNAVVPALVLQIFKAIQQYEEIINNQ